MTPWSTHAPAGTTRSTRDGRWPGTPEVPINPPGTSGVPLSWAPICCKSPAGHLTEDVRCAVDLGVLDLLVSGPSWSVYTTGLPLDNTIGIV